MDGVYRRTHLFVGNEPELAMTVSNEVELGAEKTPFRRDSRFCSLILRLN